jgi:AcrR family transcriptional regulator
VDRHAGVPAGTTSFYFRTRKALLQAIGNRITELDVADLSMMAELGHDDAGRYSGTLGLAQLVMLSGTEPYLTRTRARFEIVLSARQDPELDETFRNYGMLFYALAREVIAQWYDDPDVPDSVIEEGAVTVLTFISGVMTSFVNGYSVVSDATHLDRLIRQILRSSDLAT